MQKRSYTVIQIVFVAFYLLPCSVSAYEVFRRTVEDSHAPHELPRLVSFHQFGAVSEDGNRLPLHDTLVLEELILSDDDVGMTFGISQENDAEFQRFVKFITDGADQFINENTKFAEHAVFAPSDFDHVHRDVLESEYFRRVGTPHPLFNGPDFSGFEITSIDLTLERFVGGPGRFDIDESTFTLTYFGRFRADFDGTETLDAHDIDLLTEQVGGSDLYYDLNGDELVDHSDRETWVNEIRRTYFGDADLDGEFNAGDLIAVFQAGQYNDSVLGNSTWVTGDWNGDGDFDSGDLVLGLASGGYGQGPRELVRSVPEPTSVLAIFWPLLLFYRHSQV